MEEERKTSPGFFSLTLKIFAIDILFLMAAGYFFGEDGEEISTIFQMGRKGIAFSTLAQFLLSAVCISGLQHLIFFSRLFQKRTALFRTILLLLSIFIVILICIFNFRWFPINEPSGWAGFMICFAVCFGFSSGFMFLKTKRDNEKFERLLAAYKKDHAGEGGGHEDEFPDSEREGTKHGKAE